ncbi:hypothetical protein [Bartonella acomydis]|uniref:Uncharacterized protein n=1 Tax=Bartonella acomydis TaxID=686234 RepID=A0ABP9MHU9_9HYPH
MGWFYSVICWKTSKQKSKNTFIPSPDAIFLEIMVGSWRVSKTDGSGMDRPIAESQRFLLPFKIHCLGIHAEK